MKIKTSEPIILDRAKITQKVGKFWNQISEGWRKVWGEHIHHGYYEDNQSISPADAQVKLIEKLVGMLEIAPNNQILDVGCGMGGSSLYLAGKHQAIVTGITLSQKQIEIATQQAKIRNINTVNFKIEDALSLKSLADNSVDIVWSLESCEQFFDKKLFIEQAYRVLKPGGQLMLATWCSDKEEYEGYFAKKYKKLCLAFDLPYMPTIEYYRRALLAQQFVVKTTLDWSGYVKKSWDIGISLLNAYNFLQVLKMAGWRGFRFAQQTKMMHEGFQEDRVKYGVFIAVKPS